MFVKNKSVINVFDRQFIVSFKIFRQLCSNLRIFKLFTNFGEEWERNGVDEEFFTKDES